MTLLLAVLTMAACASPVSPANTAPDVLIKPQVTTAGTPASVTAEPSETPSAVPSINGSTIQRIYGKDDTKIETAAGMTFIIQLDENPTTGYQWADAVISDSSVIKQADSSYASTPVASDIVGSGGTRTITFKALKAGTVTITLNYQRSWEKKPAETLTFNVTVK